MALPLPPGLVAAPVTDPFPLRGARSTSFRFDLLGTVLSDDGTPLPESLIGTLDGVEPSGSVDWTYNASIKGGGKITVNDTGQDVDWLNVRIRPSAVIAFPDGQQIEFPVGVFLPAAPVEEWSAEGRQWSVELLDKNSILDQDVVTDANGDAYSVSLSPGTNVLLAVSALIIGAGESAQALPSDTKTLSGPMTWDVGTSRLKIINDLLDAANYFSLWVDGQGQYRATPYTAPADRSPIFDLLAPFDATGPSLMTPDWKRDRDIFSVPNRFVAIGQGDAETPALTATATNVDPASPYSYPSRGRWITHTETGVEAVDQAALDAYAARRLASATSVTSALSIEHPILPDFRVNEVVRLVNPAAGLNIVCAITKTAISFDPVALVKTELREVTGLADEPEE